MENEFRALRPDEMKDEMQSLKLLFRETYLKLVLFLLNTSFSPHEGQLSGCSW